MSACIAAGEEIVPDRVLLARVLACRSHPGSWCTIPERTWCCSSGRGLGHGRRRMDGFQQLAKTFKTR